MFDQTFSLVDIPKVIPLIFIEGMLSIDNALAIALIVRGLPQARRQKALFIGLVSSVFLRAFGILSVAYLIQLYWVQIVGGGYLLYLSLSHLITKRRAEVQAPIRRNFWVTVFLLEITDFIFAIDSILAGLAMVGVSFTHREFCPKIWIVYLGGLLGIITMRFAAKFFTAIMDRFPRLEIGAHLIVGWIGLKLILDVSLRGLPTWTEPLFWLGMVLFFACGFIKTH
ncbi:MAG: hypothetical protein QNJ27_02280 [Simkaniaceae bacterium]|nr:hypothetical protein [Simkaniaceae bacterium]